MSQIQRTNEDFTSGIVNVPQNTPALLIFNLQSEREKITAISIMNLYAIPFEDISKRGKIKLVSKEPIDGKLITRIQHELKYLEVKRKAFHSYPFFELDSKSAYELTLVLEHYGKYKLPVYYHESMRGYHFLSPYPLEESRYTEFMKVIKPLNVACPHITIRIRPNKWQNEREIFMRGGIQDMGNHADTNRLKRWLEDVYQAQTYTDTMIALSQLKRKYKIVNYRMTGEEGNL